MDKEQLLEQLSNHIQGLNDLSYFIEALKSAEPWFQSPVVQNWVTLKISTQYIRDSLLRLYQEIK